MIYGRYKSPKLHGKWVAAGNLSELCGLIVQRHRGCVLESAKNVPTSPDGIRVANRVAGAWANDGDSTWLSVVEFGGSDFYRKAPMRASMSPHASGSDALFLVESRPAIASFGVNFI